MKQILISFLFAALTLSAADLTGKWSGSIERIGGPLGGVRTDDHFLTIKQTGTTLTGTAGPKRVSAHPDSGTPGKYQNSPLEFYTATPLFRTISSSRPGRRTCSPIASTERLWQQNSSTS